MLSPEFKLELVPVTAEVGRLGTFPEATRFVAPVVVPGVAPRRDRADRAPAGARARPWQTVQAAAAVVAAGALGAIVAAVPADRWLAEAPPTQPATVAPAVPTPEATPAVPPEPSASSSEQDAEGRTPVTPQEPAASPPGVPVRPVPPPTTPTTPRRTATVGQLAPPLTHSPPGPPSPRALRDSGFISGGTHLLVSDTGRAITDLVVQSRCAPKAPLPPIPIRADGSFRFSGPAPGARGTSVTLSGRFVSARVATLRIRFLGPGCDSGVRKMTLRLS